MKKFFAAAILGGCITIAALPAQATSLVSLTTHQLVDASSTVIRGVVTEVWTEEDADGRVWTRVQIEVSHTYKGDPKTTAYIVDQMGGQFGGNISEIPGAARFSVGEDGLFFLETLGNGRLTTVGFSQGKYTARLDPYSQELIAQRFVPASRQAYDHRFIPLPKAGDRLPLAELIATIEARVKQGWDGAPIPGANMNRLQHINSEVAR
jgi:hypothetical protein